MPTRPPISLADLAQSFDLLRPEDEATRRRVAEALGFAAIGRTAPRPEESAARQTVAPPRPAPGLAPLADTTPFDDLPFEPVEPEPQQPEAKTQPILSFDLAGPTKSAPSGDGQSRPEWWNRITVIEKQTDPARIPPPDPLLLPVWSRTTYMQTLSTTVLEGRLDIPRLVDLVARLHVPAQIPRLPWPTMRNGVQILVDYGDAMMPFRDDQRRLVREVQALAGGNAFFEVFLFRGTPARWSRPLITRRGLPAYELPPSGAPILLLTDLGIGALAAGQSYIPPEEWQAFARSAASVGCPTTAYVPYQRDRWPPLLNGEMSLVHWHHARGAAGARAAAPSNGVGEARRLVDELAARNPQAAALAHLASLASRVELSLLRELRLTLLPAADGGAEADLWFSPLASVRNETVLLLRPETAQALRRSLFQSDPALYEDAWRIVDSFRQRTGAFEGARLEEEINYWLAQEGPTATARVEEMLRRAVKTVYERGEQDDEGLALWSVEMLDSLPAAARSSEAGRDLGVVAGFRMDRGYVPSSVLPDDIGSRQWLIPVDAANLPVASLWVGREAEGLVLAGQETLIPNGQRLEEVPATTPMVVWLSWDGNKRREKVSILPGQKTGPIPTGEHVVAIETFTGVRWTLTPTTAQTPIEEAPQLASTIQVSLTNQDVIDAFAEVIQASNLTGWALMEQNGIALSALSADRAGVYQGPDLASLPALTEEQQAMLLGRLRAVVSVAGNALEALPDDIFAYTNLRRLDLSRNQLTELPARIGDFAGLEELILDDNRLSALPPEIGRLSALQTLSAANNALSDLPGSLSRLQRLATLTLRNNQLRSLPSWFDQLAGLKSIDLRGNQMDVAASVLEQVDRPQVVLTALARVGPAEADLEIFIFPHGGASYGVTLRFRRPDAGQDKTLSASWTLDEAALRQREHDPAAYGEELAAQLLAGPDARGFLDQTLAVAASQQTPLHLRLFISGEAEALHSLRWETLRLPGSAAPLAVSEWVRFSRYVDSDNWRQVTAAPQETLRAVIAIAGPDVSDTTLAEVRTEQELAAARAGLTDITAVELAARGQVTLPNLLARLRDGCDILYLVAHGMIVDGEPQVLLEREDGGRAWTSGRELAARLGELAKPPSLAVLVSCQSAGADGQWLSRDDGALAEFGPRLAAAGLPAVVAMQGNSTMTTAAAFVPVFLAELRRNGQVDRAMAVARGAVRERPDWWMPVLFTRLLDGRLFAPTAQTPLEWSHFSDGIVYVNGIDVETGAPLVEPMDFATLAAIIKGQPVDRTKARDLSTIAQLHTTPTLGLPDGVSPTDVTKAGWAVVLHKDEDPLVRQQLERLVEHRRGQIQDDSRVKVLEYADEPDWKSWLAKHKVGVGNVFPQRVPYYLLLVGGPERIPFEFGQLLSLEYAVGLLHFDSVDGYRHYVDSLIAYETGAAPPRRKEAVFFRTQEKYDHATRLSALNLVQPLADGSPGLEDDMDKPVAATRGFTTRRVWDAAATRPALAEIFAPPAGSDPAAFLFTASHGLGFRQPHPDQPAIQGALKCQDNAGFSAKTLDETPDVRVHGLVAFFFACYGAGTPREEQYLRAVDQPPPLLADKPFIAALPKALLSHPQGGALACIGHIERAWNYSFSTSNTGEQLIPYWNAVRRILAGLPVGYALKDMRERYATLSAGLSQTLENMKFGFQPSDKELVTAWAGRNDAGGYVVIGDPATRLRLDTLVA